MFAQDVFEPVYSKGFAALNRGDLDEYISTFAPEFFLHNLSRGIIETREQHYQGMKEVLACFPEFQLIVEEAVCQGTLEKGAVVFRCRFVSGPGKGTFYGIPVDGKKVDYILYWAAHLVDGKYVEGWQLDDGLAFYIQLGVIPPMSGS